MRNCLLYLFISLSISGLLESVEYQEFEEAKRSALERCLEECWSVDRHTTSFIRKIFESMHDQSVFCALVDDFINKSTKLNIQFSYDKTLRALSEDDGVIKSTKQHIIVFENPYVRILAGAAASGEYEPLHTHAWKSIMVIFEEASYMIEYSNGTQEKITLPVGVYELPPESYACTNLGTAEKCLRFEVKE